jgi:hypothetical protein
MRSEREALRELAVPSRQTSLIVHRASLVVVFNSTPGGDALVCKARVENAGMKSRHRLAEKQSSQVIAGLPPRLQYSIIISRQALDIALELLSFQERDIE